MNSRISLQAEQLVPLISAQALLRQSVWRWLALILILVSSVVIRFYGIQEEPMLFHPIKQYRSAITARALYYNSMDDGAVPKWKRDVANANVRDIGVLQPPIESWIAARMYRLIGAEALWLGYTTAVEDRFEALSTAVQAGYFVVADRDEFAAQPELQQFIVSRFPVFTETQDYVIFALK